LAHHARMRALKMALIGAMITVLAEGGIAATITVHAPDGQGRVFIDVLGKINDGDFKTFKEKTDQIYPTVAGHPKKQIIVTLTSSGGSVNSALQIGDQIRKRGMSTFVPRAQLYQRVRTYLARRSATNRWQYSADRISRCL